MGYRLPVKAVALTLLLAVGLHAADVEVVLHERLGVAWANELVHESLSFAPGDLFRPAVDVRDPSGQPIRCQVTDVTRHDDGSIRSMLVWFRVDLSAGGRAVYTLSPGKTFDLPASVRVKREGRFAAITTDAPQAIGIRIPADDVDFAWPTEFDDRLAPIQSLLLPSGQWVGRPRINGPLRLKSFRSRIINEGPLFVDAELHYVLEEGWWHFRVRVVANQPLIEIHESLDTGDSGLNAGNTDRFFDLVLNTDGFKPTQGWYSDNSPGAKWHDLGKQLMPKRFEPYMTSVIHTGIGINGYTLSFDEPRDDYYLMGWPMGQRNIGVMARYLQPGGDSIGFTALRVEDWRNPMSLRFHSNPDGELMLRLPIQKYEQMWKVDGFGEHSPNYTGCTLYVPTTHTKRSYGIMLSQADDGGADPLDTLIEQVAHVVDHPLDVMRRRTFDWPDPMADAAWAEESSEAAKAVLDELRTRVHAIHTAGNHLYWNMGNHIRFTRGLFQKLRDVIDDPAQLTAADRAELRRLCAFVAYRQSEPYQSPYGTGVHLMNPNMTTMAIEARIAAASLIKDHPDFAVWTDEAFNRLNEYFDRYTTASGAPYETPHYTLGGTMDWSMKANQMFIDAGVGDALDSELFRRSMRFIIQCWITPPDPRFNGHRVIVPFGNTSYQSVPPDAGERFVRYFMDRDPELASQLQWFANQTLPPDKQIDLVQSQAPSLRSGWYKDYGVVFRHGAGTPHESFMHLLAGRTFGHYEAETDQMAYTIYAKGFPIHLHFGNGVFPMLFRPWLRNRVSFDMKVEAMERNPIDTVAAAFSDESDYAHAVRETNQLMPLEGEYPLEVEKTGGWTEEEYARRRRHVLTWDAPENFMPLTIWHRQIMMLKDADPKGPNYYVLRDTFDGRPTKPTDLNLWFLANEMTRQGDVFHFDGQIGVDMDVYVNTPAPGSFEPHTDRYGHRLHPYRLETGHDLSQFPDGKRGEHQLLLRIGQPAGAGYLTVLYPRLKGSDPPATYRRIGDGAVRVETPLSTDYVFMDSTRRRTEVDGIAFTGCCGAVRQYRTGRIIVVNHEGSATVSVAGRMIRGNGSFVVELSEAADTIVTHGNGVEVTINRN